jgi:signal transduction histidine kinase/CheY-like chemotaxis protein
MLALTFGFRRWRLPITKNNVSIHISLWLLSLNLCYFLTAFESIVGQILHLPPVYFWFLPGICKMSKSKIPSKKELLDELQTLRARVGELEAELQRLTPTSKDSGPLKQSQAESRQEEEPFAEANKMEAIGHLAGGVAHNFNNMLTIIINYTRMMLRHIDSQHPFYVQLKGIEKAADRCAVLTNQLLAFGRRQFLLPKEININNLIVGLDKQLHRLLGNNIVLTLRLDANLTSITADPNKLEQALLTLVAHSCSNMPEDGALKIETMSVTVDEQFPRSQASFKTKRYALVVISDNGLGMDEKTLGHLFEPFYDSNPRAYGKGLEMASVYGIIKQSGGHIAVESVLGKGTTFKLYFPLIENPEEEEQHLEKQAMTITILLVDDEDQVREVIEVLLDSLGYKTLSADNGEEALKLSQEYPGPIHLLLTDVLMPNMHGLELARKIQALRPGLPSLFMSGNVQEVYELEGKESEIAFLAKPFSLEELERKVKDAIEASLYSS